MTETAEGARGDADTRSFLKSLGFPAVRVHRGGPRPRPYGAYPPVALRTAFARIS